MGLKNMSIAQALNSTRAGRKIAEMGYLLSGTDNGDLMVGVCCICNPQLMSNMLEKLEYQNVDEEDQIYGAFIVDPQSQAVLVSCVVDLRCTTLCQREGVDPSGYLEIALLCSNPTERVPGLASLMLDVIKEITPILGRNKLVLIVANYERNPGAVAFYERNGFQHDPAFRSEAVLSYRV